MAVAAAALCLDAGTSHAGMYGNSRWCAVTNQGSGALNWGLRIWDNRGLPTGGAQRHESLLACGSRSQL